MKSISKIVCCGVAVAWMYSATANEDAAASTSAVESEVITLDSEAAETPQVADAAASAQAAGGGGRVLIPKAVGSAGSAPAAAAGATAPAPADTGAIAPAPTVAGGASDAMTTAASGVAAPAEADDVVVPTPPAPKIAVKPYHDKVDRASVEKRIEDNATRTKKRSADAEKDAAERKAQQGQANPVQSNQ